MPSTSPPSPPARSQVSVARSVDATPDLLPILHQLFRGIPNLGSSPASVERLARAAGINSTHTVLDLACGKGEIALRLAHRLGCTVVGCDAFQPFIDAARLRATASSLDLRCTFKTADIDQPYTFPVGPFHAALMIGLRPFNVAAKLLRQSVQPGGIYIMDDALRDPHFSPAHRGFQNVETIDDAARFIQSLGDTPLIAFPQPPAALRRLHDSLARRLARNAATLEQSHPQLRTSLRAFIRRQVGASDHLTGPLRPVLLAVRKGK